MQSRSLAHTLTMLRARSAWSSPWPRPVSGQAWW